MWSPTGSLPASTGLTRLAGAELAAGGKLFTATTLPAAVDLTAFAVPPGDQGQHGACASWTTAYTMAGWESKYWHLAGAPFQPMFVYNQVNGGSDTGGRRSPTTSTSWRPRATSRRPPGRTRSPTTRASRPCRADQRRQARDDAALDALPGPGQGAAARTAIESAIAANRPVAIGIPVYDSFFYIGPTSGTYGLASEAGYFEGYHAVTVLGYNAAGVRIENSWGTGWGAGGFATLGWDFVESEVFEAEAAGTFVASPLTPSVTALSQHVVAADGGASLTVTAARLTSVDTRFAVGRHLRLDRRPLRGRECAGDRQHQHDSHRDRAVPAGRGPVPRRGDQPRRRQPAERLDGRRQRGERLHRGAGARAGRPQQRRRVGDAHGQRLRDVARLVHRQPGDRHRGGRGRPRRLDRRHPPQGAGAGRAGRVVGRPGALPGRCCQRPGLGALPPAGARGHAGQPGQDRRRRWNAGHRDRGERNRLGDHGALVLGDGSAITAPVTGRTATTITFLAPPLPAA